MTCRGKGAKGVGGGHVQRRREAAQLHYGRGIVNEWRARERCVGIGYRVTHVEQPQDLERRAVNQRVHAVGAGEERRSGEGARGRTGLDDMPSSGGGFLNNIGKATASRRASSR